MKYEFVLHTPDGNISVGAYKNSGDTFISGFQIKTNCSPIGKYELIEMTVSSNEEKKVYISLAGEGEAELHSFNGACRDERIFRQSPHGLARHGQVYAERFVLSECKRGRRLSVLV